MECFAIRNSIEAMQPYQIDNIIARWVELKNKIISGKHYDAEDIFKLDAETHEYFVESSDNVTLAQMVGSLKLKINRYQKMFTQITNNDLSTVNQHIEILQAVKAKDAKTACSLLEKHIFTPLNRVFENNKLDVY